MNPEKEKIGKQVVKLRKKWKDGPVNPINEEVRPEKLPKNSPAKDLQSQAEAVPKTNYGDYGPPKNSQSIPTQNTHEISADEEEIESRGKKNP